MSLETTAGTIVSATDWFESVAAGDNSSWLWMQKAKRSADELVSHWDFKAPLALLRTPVTLAGIVPNVRHATGESLRAQPPFLDGALAPLRIGTGLAHAWLVTHSTYARAPNATLRPLNGSISWSYWVLLASSVSGSSANGSSATEEAGSSASEAGSGGGAPWSVGPFARFLWRATGANDALRASPSLQRNYNPATLPGSADPGTFDEWAACVTWSNPLHRVASVHRGAECRYRYAWRRFSSLFWTDCGSAGGFFRQRINATGGAAVGGRVQRESNSQSPAPARPAC
jgi:hypothetical protein